MAGKIYVSKVSGSADLPDGSTAHLQAGITRVREGHPLLAGREDLFQELDVHYDIETARQAPKAEAKPEPVKAKVVEEDPEPLEDGPAGLTSKDAPGAPQPRGRRRVTKTGD